MKKDYSTERKNMVGNSGSAKYHGMHGSKYGAQQPHNSSKFSGSEKATNSFNTRGGKQGKQIDTANIRRGTHSTGMKIVD